MQEINEADDSYSSLDGQHQNHTVGLEDQINMSPGDLLALNLFS
jgi:hypothetical protein